MRKRRATGLLLPALGLILGGGAQAQIAPPPAMLVAAAPAPPLSPEALSARYLGRWRGVWVGPDLRPNPGDWPGDLLTPDGRAVGVAEFENFQGTAFVIIRPGPAQSDADWQNAWLGDCHNKLSTNGFYGGEGLCESWLRYYRQSGLAYQTWAYAVPVALAMGQASGPAGCGCTVTREVVTEVVRVPRVRDKRLKIKAKK